MKFNKKITPEGTRDILFDECVARREVESKLASIYKNRGYSEVITPTLEYYDVFSTGSGALPSQMLFKLTGNKGNLLVMRPDVTTSIARLAATRLKESLLPIRIYYNLRVFKSTRSFSGKMIEILQSGIELLGAEGLRADLEIITTACLALDSCGISEYRLEINHVGFFEAIFSSMNIPDEEKENIRTLIESKNYASLNDLLDTLEDSKQTRALRQLPRLFGSIDVLDEAEELFSDEKAKKSLDYLKVLYNALTALGLEGKIAIDLGIVHRNEYYTGVVFRGYVEGSGIKVLSGGRYDNLIEEFGKKMPAIGFAIDVDAFSTAMLPLGLIKICKPGILVFGTDGFEIKALEYANKLINEGNMIENCIFETREQAIMYAKEKRFEKLVIVSEQIEEILIGKEKSSCARSELF